jgi:DNA-binding IclR family transcriptional regulator
VSASPSAPTLIQSVQRALRLVEIIAEHEGRARAKELARAAGLPLATTYHLLRTCAHEGWLQRLDDGSYVLGHRLDLIRDHGSAARNLARTRPALEWLRDEMSGAVSARWSTTSRTPTCSSRCRCR